MTAPADLRPYVVESAPLNEDVPVFRAEEIGVRFIETYIRQMYVRVAETPLSIRICDTNGVVISGRESEWRKAEDHVDRSGQLAYLTRVNEIYGTSMTPSAMPRDDVLVAVPDSLGGGVLPASVTLEAAVVATGTGAPAGPLFTYRFRTSRYCNLADWVAALPESCGTFANPGLPDALWIRTETLSIAEEALLTLMTEPTPDTPMLRRMSRENKPPVLMLSMAEPMPARRVQFALWELPPPQDGVGAPAPGEPVEHIATTSYRVPFQTEHLTPLARFKGAPVVNTAANPIARLQRSKHDRFVAELEDIPAPLPPAREVPLKVVWLEDGSRAFLIPTDSAERIAGGWYDLEVRYAHVFPDTTGDRVVDTARVRVEIPGP
jgi:hypothetical protein